ncbi:uncharacterized protein RCC_01843 [Ramularia collo-cygni]|uniref:Uncharacterized protein n=1 Tax=Ramularia collo-cygni TaxID=112498 RepID=A0A2D3V6Q1_9PEZI|nr:uncharacterized protein RCC_01843 [Ramularia collo-cygni]CZT16003.1 uncharacterized protein RCC_01843 [Ramularia collo-cygni]
MAALRSESVRCEIGRILKRVNTAILTMLVAAWGATIQQVAKKDGAPDHGHGRRASENSVTLGLCGKGRNCSGQKELWSVLLSTAVL